MATFALSTEHGPHWDESRGIREQDAWAEHAAFMDGLVDEGFILVGGPLGDGEHTLHMVEADDEREIEDPHGRGSLGGERAAADRHAAALEHLAGEPASRLAPVSATCDYHSAHHAASEHGSRGAGSRTVPHHDFRATVTAARLPHHDSALRLSGGTVIWRTVIWSTIRRRTFFAGHSPEHSSA